MVVLESYLLDIVGELLGNGSKDSGGDDSVRLPYRGVRVPPGPSAVASLDLNSRFGNILLCEQHGKGSCCFWCFVFRTRT